MTFRWIALGTLVVSACTPSSESARDGVIDAGPSAREASVMDARVIPDARAAVTECPLGDEQCLSRYPEWGVSLRVGDVEPDASFRALGGYAVLLEHAAGFELLRLVPSGAKPERWRFPAGWRAVDVYAGDPIYGGEQATVWALACREASCAVFSGERGADTLRELSPVLPGTEYRGLVLVRDGETTLPCAFGAGLACLVDGAWRSWIEPIHTLREVVLEGWTLFALSDTGEYWRGSYGDGKLGLPELQPAKIPGAYVGFSEGYGGLAVTSSAGSTQLHEDGGVTQCVVPGLQSLWLDNGYQEGGALFADGRLLLKTPHRWCQQQTIELDGPLVGSGREHCAIGYMSSILSTSTLWRSDHCIYSIP